MLLIALLTLLSVVSIIGIYKVDKYKHEVIHFVCEAVSFISTVVLILLMVWVGIEWMRAPADTEESKARYESLYEQAYRNMYKSDRSKKKLADQITEWNEDLAELRELNNSIWLSCFYPVDASRFKEIPIGLVERTVG